MQRTVCVCVCVCVRDAGADAADGGYVVRSMWILWMTSSLSSHSTSASVSELSRLSTHRQNAIVKRDPSLTVSRFKHYLNDTGIAVF